MQAAVPRLGRPAGPCQLCGAKTCSNWRRIPASVGTAVGQSACNPCYVRLLKQVREDPTQIDKALAACRVRWQPDPTDVVAQVVAFDNQLMEAAAAGMLIDPPSAPAGSPAVPPLECLSAAWAAACPRSPLTAASTARSGEWVSTPMATAFAPGALAPYRTDARQPPPLPQPLPPQQMAPLQQAPLPQQVQQQLLQTHGEGVATGSPVSRSSQTPAQQAAVEQGEPDHLFAMQQATWRQLDSSHDASLALTNAYNAASQLPGLQPRLLAALPALWLLLPGAYMSPLPVGALLLSVDLPHPSLAAPAQSLLLRAREGLLPALRLVVFCRRTGQLLQQRDWVEQEESTLYRHPRHHVPAWDSSCGWQLLFPEPTNNTAEARLFRRVVELAGVAPPAPPTQPSFTVSSVSGQQASSASPFASPAALTFPLAAGTTAGQQLQPPMLLWPLQARQQHEAAVMAAAALPFSSMQFGATQVAAAAPLVSLGSPAARTGTPQQLPNFWPALGTAAPQQTPAVAPAVASCLPQLPCSPQAVWGQVAPQPPLLQPAISRASVSIPPANRANSLAGMFLPPFDLPTSPSVDLIDEVMLDWIGGLDSNARGAGGINLTT